MKAPVVALAVTYPFLAHAAAATGEPKLLAAAAGVLVVAVTLPGLARGSKLAAAGLAAGAAAIYALARADALHLVPYAPPVLIAGLLAWLFGRTLLGGRMPLIEALVRAIHPPGDPVLDTIGPYTRRLTLAWAALLGAIALVDLALAALARPRGILATFGIDPGFGVAQPTWSLFANFVGYALIAAFAALEYRYRRRVFPVQPYRNFADFVRRVATTAPAVFRPRR